MYKPRTIDQALMPLILANAVLGMGYFEYRTNRGKKIIGLLYSAVCVLIYCFVTKVSIEYLELFYPNNTRDVGNITFKALFYGNVCLALCMIFTGWIKTKNMRMIIGRIEVCEKNMEKIGIPKDYQTLFLNQLNWLAIFAVSTGIFAVVNYIWLFDEEAPLDIRVALAVTVQYPVILLCVVDISFYYWVRYARLKFQKLNDLLRGMLTTTPQSPQHKRVLAMKYDLINKDFATFRTNRSRGSNDNTEIMKAVKQIHLELVKSARNMNEVYGFQILLAMTASFVLITGLLYDAYAIIWFDVAENDFVREIVPVACWITFYALKIFFINHACAKTSAEAANTGDIICELYEPSTTREFRAEIRDFTLQLIQNPLTFTACGFFDLDHTFIQGVIGSITTYLVILIQVGEIQTPESNTNMTTPANRSDE